MGIGVSDWRLARAVSELGQLGVVSGTALDTVFVRRLQLGDPDGRMRRAIAAFPNQEIAERVQAQYFVPGGIPENASFKLLPMPGQHLSRRTVEVMLLANFVEVFLAKEGHSGIVGINYLEKVQLPTLPSLFGAMLAGVDYVLMGAGIPLAIPGALDALAKWRAVELKLNVKPNPERLSFPSPFDPKGFFSEPFDVHRPEFLAIISSHVIAKTMVKKASGRVSGFVIEEHTAGGHNAPPRKGVNDADPENSFGALDTPNLSALRDCRLPFWLAGQWASPARLEHARTLGAAGIQVGTLFAYCDESGIAPEHKRSTIERVRRKRLQVVTDFQASPTGYPFKLVHEKGDDEELQRLRQRERVCDLGYLRQAYTDEQGNLGFRCSGEPVETYVKKGGDRADTVNKMCLCNGLLATVGLGQRRDYGTELPIFTAGKGIDQIADLLRGDALSYSAHDVIEFLLAPALHSIAPDPELRHESDTGRVKPQFEPTELLEPPRAST